LIVKSVDMQRGYAAALPVISHSSTGRAWAAALNGADDGWGRHGAAACATPRGSSVRAVHQPQLTEQLAPLSAKAVGAAVLPVWVAWKPIPTDALGAMLPLYDMLLAVTCPLDGL